MRRLARRASCELASGRAVRVDDAPRRKPGGRAATVGTVAAVLGAQRRRLTPVPEARWLRAWTDTPLRDVLPPASIARCHMIHPSPRLAASVPQTGHRSRSAWHGCADVSCTPDTRNAGSGRPTSRTIASDAHGWGSLGPCGPALVRVPSAGRMFRRRRASIAAESRRDPRSRVSSPRLRAAELCSVCLMVVKPSRLSLRSDGSSSPTEFARHRNH
jgi:hypothetical protein